MPGWHERTQQLEASGQLKNISIVQEQHPSRTRLFMQWQGISWPTMVDSLNLLGLEVVPVTLLIDEEGIVRYRGSVENLEAFLALEAPASLPKPKIFDKPALAAQAPEEALVEHANQLFLWGGDARLDEVIETYQRRLSAIEGDSSLSDERARLHFRLGVSLRRRADSDHRQAGDFRAAVEHWQQALEIEPNQYIWRRRIQQYGPRLEKPYSFYDWVEAARREIEARGETPVALDIEPRGAELATPSRDFAVAAEAEPPTQAYRITRDEAGLIDLEKTLVPAAVTPGSAARVHLVFRTNPAVKGHWNNEADDTEVWIEAPEGWQIDRRRLTVGNPPQLVSDEPRHFELEVRSPKGAESTELQGFALYYVCEDVQGTCLYRRQDFTVELPVRSGD